MVPALEDVDRRRVIVSIVWELIRTIVRDNVVTKRFTSHETDKCPVIKKLALIQKRATFVGHGLNRVTEIRPTTSIIYRTMSHG